MEFVGNVRRWRSKRRRWKRKKVKEEDGQEGIIKEERRDEIKERWRRDGKGIEEKDEEEEEMEKKEMKKK